MTLILTFKTGQNMVIHGLNFGCPDLDPEGTPLIRMKKNPQNNSLPNRLFAHLRKPTTSDISQTPISRVQACLRTAKWLVCAYTDTDR